MQRAVKLKLVPCFELADTGVDLGLDKLRWRGARADGLTGGPWCGGALLEIAPDNVSDHFPKRHPAATHGLVSIFMAGFGKEKQSMRQI